MYVLYVSQPQVMSRMGIQATEEEAAELFALVDTNKDGRISTKEFASYIGLWKIFVTSG